MEEKKTRSLLKEVLNSLPNDWLTITTHRLDIYNEKQAKTAFLNQFEQLLLKNNVTKESLSQLPTAYDYIRLGHPLSCLLEWAIAQLNGLNAENVISFSSVTTPILAVLRKNLLENKKTHIFYTDTLPACFDPETIKNTYGYDFELKHVDKIDAVSSFDGSTIFLSQENNLAKTKINSNIDFYISLLPNLGSLITINGTKNSGYISEIQHVRRRETIAMTPANCKLALDSIVNLSSLSNVKNNREEDKSKVINTIKEITGSQTTAIVGSSGLSIQYAILMGLIDYANKNHKGKAIKFVVPPNCYGGTNDQARRVAACIKNVDIVDLPVDGDNNMVQSVEIVLNKIAQEDAVPYIIAEIPTNPRVEVPDMIELKNVLSKKRTTKNGQFAVDPVFILDQTFCPNVHFLGDNDVLSSVRTISFASGSKFPSGGLCTSGYCTANKKAAGLMNKLEKHLLLCDNEATNLQYEILAKQMSSMKDRITKAYKNTREFVNYIREVLPEAKINFVSEELASQGFTPSVFSLDLPTKGNTNEEKESFKRKLNDRLISLMINEIPSESKYCVSYGQLKGCYWTIPATSTQGTTKEGDKDYIVRVALSGNMNIAKHKEVFLAFVKEL